MLQEFLSTWVRDGMPDVTPGGVVPWSEVADRVLAVPAIDNPTLQSREISTDIGFTQRPVNLG